MASAAISVTPDTQAISNAINNFVAAYSNLITFASQNAQYINPLLLTGLKQSYTYRAANLAAIGITQNPVGTLTINQNLLTSAIQNNLGLVETAFSGSNGLAVIAGLKAQQIATSPLNTFANLLPLDRRNYLPIYTLFGVLNTSSLWSLLLPPGQLFDRFV